MDDDLATDSRDESEVEEVPQRPLENPGPRANSSRRTVNANRIRPEAVEEQADLPATPTAPARSRISRPTAAARSSFNDARTVAATQPELGPIPEPFRDPNQLKRISAIQPFYNYEPDPERMKEDPCHNLCPRPKTGCPDCRKEGSDKGLECPDCPEEVLLSTGILPPRNFPELCYLWEPSNLWSYPLYFEDYELERYGHTHGCLQPLWSVGRFGLQLGGLPYQMTIDPMRKKRYSLGYYRPGTCVPYKYYQVPWNTEAALVEAGVLTGAYFLFAPSP